MDRKCMKTTLIVMLLVSAFGVGLSRAQDPPKDAKNAPKASTAKSPAVSGDWTGDWGLYIPPPKSGDVPAGLMKMMYPETCLPMVCTVVAMPEGKWQATFEGAAHGPYKYKIKLQGRQAGNAVLFQGTADLGEKDGGVFDWIGRATDKEFVGFFTSKGYTGTFRMTHPQK